jgi:hypothetical protein
MLPNINSKFLLPLNNLILNTGSSESSVYNTFFTKWLKQFFKTYNYNTTTDGVNKPNILRTFYGSPVATKKKPILKSHKLNKNADELANTIQNSYFTWNLFNQSRNYRFKDLKSSNLQFLSPDKNTRDLLDNRLNTTNRNFSFNTNTGSLQDKSLLLSTGISDIYSNANSF